MIDKKELEQLDEERKEYLEELQQYVYSPNKRDENAANRMQREINDPQRNAPQKEEQDIAKEIIQ
jgi:hypothetical protein